MRKIEIGTSGWSYHHWKENFYPLKLGNKKWLNFYSSFFSTVEINSSFYHVPRETSVENWYAQVPDNFLFSIKASRVITHLKKLKNCQDSLLYFFKSLQPLQDKQGPILFQLPPSFSLDLQRLEEFVACLSNEYKYAFEFRHPSWFVEEVYHLLQANNLALCLSDLKDHPSPEIITANFTYMRLHGPHNAYSGSYGSSNLKVWKKKIEKWSAEVSVFCYFDNDEKGYAVQDAQMLKDFLESTNR